MFSIIIRCFFVLSAVSTSCRHSSNVPAAGTAVANPLGVPDSEYDDLVQEGVIGLMSALDRFDESKEISIIKYCEFRIKGSMLDYLRKQDVTPRGIRERIRQKELDIQRYKDEFKQQPTRSEMADFLEMDCEEYQKKFCDVTGLSFFSIFQIVGKDEGDESLKLIDVIQDEKQNGHLWRYPRAISMGGMLVQERLPIRARLLDSAGASASADRGL